MVLPISPQVLSGGIDLLGKLGSAGGVLSGEEEQGGKSSATATLTKGDVVINTSSKKEIMLLAGVVAVGIIIWMFWNE
jgi:hypothetical protein